MNDINLNNFILKEFNFKENQLIIYVDSEKKISQGTILGTQIHNVYLKSDGSLLKSGVVYFQIQNLMTKKIEMISNESVFKNFEDALKHVCSDIDVFLKLKNEMKSQGDLNSEKLFSPVGTFDEYQSIAMSTKNYGKGLPLFYPVIKLNGEAGEVAEKVGKIWRDKEGDVSEEDRIEILKELGDNLYYIVAAADDLKSNLAEVANLNIKKILDRRSRGVISGNGDNR